MIKFRSFTPVITEDAEFRMSSFGAETDTGVVPAH